MHELSLAEALLDLAITECHKAGCSKIQSITLKVGKASGAMPDALKFSFEVLKNDTIAQDASLDIISVSVSARCKTCSKVIETDELYIFECPYCKGLHLELLTGRELEITKLEVS